MAVREPVNLDRVVDYKAEYCSVIQNYRISGDNLLGLCPFHEDNDPSFSVDLITGKWTCFAEGESGNFITFWAKLHGYGDDTRRAYKEILEKYGIHADAQSRPAHQARETERRMAPESYTLRQYSFEKHLPEDWLVNVCRLSTERDRNWDGVTWLKTPYLNVDGELVTYRKRYGNKDFRWKQGAQTRLYGEWRLPEFQQQGYVVLVEGESDTQTLWYIGIPAIGAPGANTFKPEQARLLQDLTLYLHKEPDQGGDTFIQKTCANLHRGGFIGQVKLWSCSKFGVKDPSDLYLQHGKEEAERLIREALEGAELVDLEAAVIPEAVSGAPLRLRQPEGWIYSDKGISISDEKKYAPVSVCRTPIILTKRIKHIETGEEKIEVAFKRDGQWMTAIYPRSTVFSNRSILVLSELGCTLTSENAKQVVKFLGALEAENLDILPKVDAASTMGWHTGRRFLPGKEDNLVLDIDPTQRGVAAAYCKNGTMGKWVEHMAPHRQRQKFRFILAASFAAPLLRIVQQRNFIVYNWGGSRGGKTAALQAALSVWGDPERLMVSFNTTQVGLERRAALCCDVPLGIDERQQAGDKQGLLEQLIYMLANGTGKIRGNKVGGLQTVYQWRTVALGTGEEPLSVETSKGGVNTRVLGLYGGPFDDERDASAMYSQAAANHGWAGPAFIQRIIDLKEKDICEAYEQMQGYVYTVSDGKNGAHVAAVSVVAMADALIDSWFFREQPIPDTHPEPPPQYLQTLGICLESWETAKRMAKEILQVQVENNATDSNENAVQCLVDWVLSNKAYFGVNAVGTCLGFFSPNEDIVYIFPSMLDQVLIKAGHTPMNVKRYMAEQGLITTTIEKKGDSKRTVFSVTKWFNGKKPRVIEFLIGKLVGEGDSIEAVEDEYDERPLTEPATEQSTLDGFTFSEVDGDDELPF